MLLKNSYLAPVGTLCSVEEGSVGQEMSIGLGSYHQIVFNVVDSKGWCLTISSVIVPDVHGVKAKEYGRKACSR